MTEARGPEPVIQAFFDEPTNTVSYIVADPETKQAAFIDPVLDYDHNGGSVDTRSVEAMLTAADEAGYTVVWTLETHAHADHLSGSPYVKAKTGTKIGIGEHIKEVQKIFRPVFNATDLKTDGSDFDHLFVDGETFAIGNISPSRCCTRQAIRRLTSATASAATSSSAIRCSCPISVPRGPTSPAATCAPSIARSASCWPCLRRRCFTSATTTRRRAATCTPGRPRSASSASATFM